MYILCISRLFSGIWWSEKYEETSRFSLRKAPRRPTKPNSAVASLDANVMWVVAHLHGVELVGILKTSCRWIGTMAWYRIYLDYIIFNCIYIYDFHRHLIWMYRHHLPSKSGTSREQTTHPSCDRFERWSNHVHRKPCVKHELAPTNQLAAH